LGSWENREAPIVDVENLLDATTMELLREYMLIGALVSFGTSKDGGALSVHVKCGDTKNREWFRDDEHLHDWLSAGLELLSGDGTEGPSNVKAFRGA